MKPALVSCFFCFLPQNRRFGGPDIKLLLEGRTPDADMVEETSTFRLIKKRFFWVSGDAAQTDQWKSGSSVRPLSLLLAAGKWAVEQLKENKVPGDLGLVLKSRAKHHAIAAPLVKPFVFQDEPLVVQ